MIDCLLWLDASPVRYFAVALTCMAVTVALALLPAFRSLRPLVESPAGRAIFAGVCTLTLLAFRWPLVAFPVAFNPDEAQFVAQALTFVHDPLPWKAFDGNNAGPLDTAVVAVTALFAAAPSYAGARIVGLLLSAGAVACIYALVTRLYGELAGRLAALLPLAFFATAVSRDFVHYTSETLPLFLLGLVGASIAWVDREPSGRARLAAAACGLALGALPFAKIQAVPVAAVLAVAALVVAGRRRWREPAPLASPVGPLVAGLVAVPLFFLALVVWNGIFGDFVTSYISMPLEYDRRIAPGSASFSLHRNVGFGLFEFLGIVGGGVMLLATFFLNRLRGRDPERTAGQWIPPAVALVALFAANYAVARPHSDYVHYLLWLVMPISAFFGTAAGVLLNAGLRTASTKRRLVPLLALAIALVATVPLSNFRLAAGYPLYASLAEDLKPERDPVVLMLERSIQPGERISVWGWMPDYYVATGALLGTRDAITQFQIVPSSYRAYYRARYLRDFAANRPAYFIDAVSPSTFAYHDAATQGPQAFPELARIVAADYRQIGESYGVRLYERIR